ncbi:MAG: IS256 family transposase [Candidatus Adiutrix sp.]|nr:IS256 family transposase [Candidatus Adiutrix sp.]
MAIDEKLLDQLIAGYKKQEDLIGENGLLKELTRRLLERAMSAELTEHLGHGKNQRVVNSNGNVRNGHYSKKVKGEFGEIEVEVSRDRDSSFEPLILPKGQSRFMGFDGKIISLYARGMTTREIQCHIEETYGVEVSPSLISTATKAVTDKVRKWQGRPLEEVYPIVYLDAVRIKGRCDGRMVNKAVHLAIGVNMEGAKEVLGMWASENEGAKFWLQIMTELKNRGVKDIFIACVDGLKGFPEAIEAAFPGTEVQLCIVHLVRNSLNYVPWKDRKSVAADLRAIYNASNAEEAELKLVEFEEKWSGKYPSIGPIWRRNWERLIPFFAYPAGTRKAIYTINALESLNISLKKVTKNRAPFPNDEAVFRLLYLALRNIDNKWTMPIRDWKAALNCFSILFENRMPTF